MGDADLLAALEQKLGLLQGCLEKQQREETACNKLVSFYEATGTDHDAPEVQNVLREQETLVEATAALRAEVSATQQQIQTLKRMSAQLAVSPDEGEDPEQKDKEQHGCSNDTAQSSMDHQLTVPAMTKANKRRSAPPRSLVVPGMPPDSGSDTSSSSDQVGQHKGRYLRVKKQVVKRKRKNGSRESASESERSAKSGDDDDCDDSESTAEGSRRERQHHRSHHRSDDERDGGGDGGKSEDDSNADVAVSDNDEAKAKLARRPRTHKMSRGHRSDDEYVPSERADGGMHILDGARGALKRVGAKRMLDVILPPRRKNVLAPPGARERRSKSSVTFRLCTWNVNATTRVRECELGGKTSSVSGRQNKFSDAQLHFRCWLGLAEKVGTNNGRRGSTHSETGECNKPALEAAAEGKNALWVHPDPTQKTVIFPLSRGEWPEVVAIGLQEVDVSAQSLLVGVGKKREKYWENVVREHLNYGRSKDDSLLSEYVLLCSHGLVGMMLMVFAQRGVAQHCSDIESDDIGKGLFKKLGNKGGVCVRFKCYGSKVLIVNSHLAAHFHHVARRNADFGAIAARFVQGDEGAVFWLGDLNYRVEAPTLALPHNESMTVNSLREEGDEGKGDGKSKDGKYKNGKGKNKNDKGDDKVGKVSNGKGDVKNGKVGKKDQDGDKGDASRVNGEDDDDSSVYDSGDSMLQTTQSEVTAHREGQESAEAEPQLELSVSTPAVTGKNSGNQSESENEGKESSCGNDGGKKQWLVKSESDGLSKRTTTEVTRVSVGVVGASAVHLSRRVPKEDGKQDGERPRVVGMADAGATKKDKALQVIVRDVSKVVNVRQYLAYGRVQELVEYDQLLRERRLGHCFPGFKEAKISFFPTFKYDVGTQAYDTSAKQRVPSWTDRVLWKGKYCMDARGYDRFELLHSDHRPVAMSMSVLKKAAFLESKLHARVPVCAIETQVVHFRPRRHSHAHANAPPTTGAGHNRSNRNDGSDADTESGSDNNENSDSGSDNDENSDSGSDNDENSDSGSDNDENSDSDGDTKHGRRKSVQRRGKWKKKRARVRHHVRRRSIDGSTHNDMPTMRHVWFRNEDRSSSCRCSFLHMKKIPSWIRVAPSTFPLAPRATMMLTFELVEDNTEEKDDSNYPAPDEDVHSVVLVLHVDGGKDFFISVER